MSRDDGSQFGEGARDFPAHVIAASHRVGPAEGTALEVCRDCGAMGMPRSICGFANLASRGIVVTEDDLDNGMQDGEYQRWRNGSTACSRRSAEHRPASPAHFERSTNPSEEIDADLRRQ